MKVILLGMDNTGKTTLATTLEQIIKKETQIPVSIIPSLGIASMNNQLAWINSQKKPEFNSSFIHIHDRFTLFEEMIYGPVLRNKSNFKLSDPIVEEVKACAPLIVYCRPSRDTIENWRDREQMEGVIDNSHRLLDAYDDLFFRLASTNWFILPYDYETTPVEMIFEAIYMHISTYFDN